MSQWTTIRRKAAQLLEQYSAIAEVQGLPAAFSPDAGPHAILSLIAGHCLGLSLMEDAGLEKGVVGAINRDEDIISFQAGLKSSKKHFVVAHEIGHDVLGHPPRPFLEKTVALSSELAAHLEKEQSLARYSWDGEKDIDEEANPATLLPGDGALRRYSTRASVELQANVFAAELLAPLEKIREWVETRGTCDLGAMEAYFGLSKNALKNQLMAALCGAAPLEEDAVLSLPDLDAKQHLAATAEGATLVVAGPGAGKTRVLAARFVHLVEKGFAPCEILALTFSHKAAEEMRLRLGAALPAVEHEITVGTFHSLGQQLLVDYWREAGFKREPSLLTDADAFVLMRSRLGELPLQSFADIFEPARNLRHLLDAIARLKDELIGPNDFRRRVEEWGQQAPSSQNKQVQKARDLAMIYERYHDWLRAECFVDYGDLILESVRLFENDLFEWELRDKYKQVLVDEFQDVNRASGRLVQLLDGGRGATWVVADPRQSIYAFRGASRANVESFTSDFPGGQVIELSKNYRSVEDIVRAANSIQFGANAEGDTLEPELVSNKPLAATPVVTAATAPNTESEIAGVIRTIEELKVAGYSLGQIAVLCRRRDTAQAVSLALEAAGVSTNWCGAMHEQSAFKDMMGVLLLACNHPHALPRLIRHPAHQLAHSDVEIVLATLRLKGGSPRATLRAVAKGEVAGLSTTGRESLCKLREIATRAARRPNASNVLTAYLWEETDWFTRLCLETSPAAQRYVATVGQVVELAREFGGKGTLSPGTKTASFVDYIRSCMETQKLKTSHDSVAIPNAVTIMTIHGSKGLEWPVVLVPGWVQTRPPFSQVAWPPDLAAQFAAGNDSRSRVCLAYVAVTRARERLIISRVEDGRTLPEETFPALVQSLEADGLLERALWPDIEADVVSPQGEVGKSATTEATPRTTLSCKDERVELDLGILEDLQFCGQKTKFARIDGLRAESTGFLLFHRILNETFAWMINAHNSTQIPAKQEIEDYLIGLWDAAKPHERQLGLFYRERTSEYSNTFSGRLARSEQVRWKVPFENHHVLPGVALKFCVDECESGDKPILRWHTFSKISSEKLRNKLRLALYSRRKICGLAPQLRVYHVPTGTENLISFTSEDWEEAKIEINRVYALWQQRVLLPQISYDCHFCAFNLICPC